MPDLPDEVIKLLSIPAYRRGDLSAVRRALDGLGVPVPPVFRTFYETFEGPFGSQRTGQELLDIIEQATNILQSTRACREHHGWPACMLVLTNYMGNSVLVLDAERDLVFDVDFEGGDQLLLQGSLAPTWNCFGDFLKYYFG